MQIDVNSDLGESFGNYKLGLDKEILKHITSANIACGFHAGDPLVMDATVQMAIEEKVALGAHPGYPDLMGFGRRNLSVTAEEMTAYIVYQVGAIKAFAESHGASLQHVKPHGAMYNMAAIDPQLAQAIAEGIYKVDPSLILMGLSGSEMIKAGQQRGLKVCNEVFADRAYNEDGTLVSRKLKGAVIHDEEVAIERVIKMIRHGKVTAITGKEIEIEVESICVHGDNPEALAFVKKIRQALEKEHIQAGNLSHL